MSFNNIGRIFASSVVLVIILFRVYSLGLPPAAVNIADSDDIILAAWGQGLAHPPGYPLQVMYFGLAHFMSGDFTRNAHQLAIALQIVLVVVWYVFAFILIRPRKFVEELSLLLIILSISLTPRNLTHAVIPEVFNMALLMSSIGAFLTVKHRYFYSGLFFGLGFISHQLTVILGLCMISAFIRTRRRIWNFFCGVILGLFLGAVAYAKIALSQSLYSWEKPATLRDWVRMFLRDIYAPNGSQIETYLDTFSLEHAISSLLFFFSHTLRELGPVLIIMSIIGILYVYRSKIEIFKIFLTGLLLSGPLLVVYMRFPQFLQSTDTEYFFGTFLRWRMFFVFEFLISIAALYALHQLSRSASNRKSLVEMTILVLLGVGGFYTAKQSVLTTYGQQQMFTTHMSQAVFDELPLRSVLIVDDDMIFSFLEKQLIQKQRADVQVIPARVPLTIVEESYWRNQLLQDIQLGLLIQSYFDQNTRVFLYKPEIRLLSVLGGSGNPNYFANSGYLIEVTRQPIDWNESQSFDISAGFSNYTPEKYQWWDLGIKGHLGLLHGILGANSARYGEPSYEEHLKFSQALSSTPTQKRILSSIMNDGYAAFEDLGSPASYAPQPYDSVATQAAPDGISASRAIILNKKNDLGWLLLERYMTTIGEDSEYQQFREVNFY